MERESFTVFLLSTAPEHHAGNEAVLCSGHFRSCLSFIIHCGYKSVKWLLVANDGLPHQFSHTRTYSFTSLWPRFSGLLWNGFSTTLRWKCNIFDVAYHWRCPVPLKRSHPLSMSRFASPNSQLKDKSTGQTVLLFIRPLCLHCAALNRGRTVELQRQAKTLIWRVIVVSTLLNACHHTIIDNCLLPERAMSH